MKIPRKPRAKTSELEILKIKHLADVPNDYSGIVVCSHKGRIWYLNGELHRIDGPAVEWSDGSKEWYLNGKLHREDGPAREWSDGTKVWYLNGKLHREDGPAREWTDGSKDWWLKDKWYSTKSAWKKAVSRLKKEEAKEAILKLKNNEDVPENYTGIVEWADGSKQWFLNGKRHRVDGPALERADGTKVWYLNGERHRVDGPALEWADGRKEWYLNGEIYSNETEWQKAVDAMKKEEAKEVILKLKTNENLPTNYTGIVEWDTGSKQWFLNGKRHRVDGPACEYPDGSKQWFLNGKRHRIDGPAVEFADGTKEWFLNGERHRVDGPAVEEVDGYKAWYLNNKRHRIDGPAIEYADGTKYWYLNGERYSNETEWQKAVDAMKKEEAKETILKLKTYEFVPKNYTGITEWNNGSKHWYLYGKLHRVDGPAVEHADGTKQWFLNGERHRVDGPAVEWPDGSKEWYLNGGQYSNETEWQKAVDAMKKEETKEVILKLKTSEFVPKNYTGIVEWADGRKEWFLNGERHRVDGPAYERADGSKHWYLNGQLHREDGPAREWPDGSKQWWLNGILHREDGPAVEHADGSKEWWVKGEHQLDPPVSTFSVVKTIIKNDAREVAKRVAVKRIIKFIAAFIADQFKSEKQLFKSIEEFLRSERGTLLLQLAISGLLPQFKSVFPEKYHGLYEEVCDEFRIQAEVGLVDGFIDTVVPAIQEQFRIISIQNSFIEDVKVRVDSSTIETETIKTDLPKGARQPFEEELQVASVPPMAEQA